ncbi:hypothetical protein F503_02574 [Ophiostoma piceae UAMH 11346]|uniref:Uncharacterized protein n=1 Tax=Ophiostoma piceae (strain UAMH 11346) TaxID=1262450 RepID=S3C3T0_OPHP1|nr:hypothetical protein F503_02574 [Ophiostoma piceae UAMH 11346]
MNLGLSPEFDLGDDYANQRGIDSSAEFDRRFSELARSHVDFAQNTTQERDPPNFTWDDFDNYLLGTDANELSTSDSRDAQLTRGHHEDVPDEEAQLLYINPMALGFSGSIAVDANRLESMSAGRYTNTASDVAAMASVALILPGPEDGTNDLEPAPYGSPQPSLPHSPARETSESAKNKLPTPKGNYQDMRSPPEPQQDDGGPSSASSAPSSAQTPMPPDTTGPPQKSKLAPKTRKPKQRYSKEQKKEQKDCRSSGSCTNCVKSKRKCTIATQFPCGTCARRNAKGLENRRKLLKHRKKLLKDRDESSKSSKMRSYYRKKLWKIRKKLAMIRKKLLN